VESRLEVLADHVQVSCTGQFDGAEARALVARIVEAAGGAGVQKVLVDLRGLSTTVGIGERYDVASLLARGGAERLRMAFLVGPENFFTKTFEDTATNRGLAVRSTTSLAEARAFLGLKDS
jgi:hypothetical protein